MTAQTTRVSLQPRLLTIICSSAEGDLDEAQLMQAGGSLPAVGYSSLATIRMIDTIENVFGVYLDPESPQLRTVDGITELVAAQLHDGDSG